MRGLNLLWVAAIALIAACGSAPSGSLPSPSPPSPTPTPKPPLAQGVVSVGPQNISNGGGSYSFSIPDGWKVIDCAQTQFNAPYTWLINPGDQCRQEMSGARAFVISLGGDQPPAAYLGEQQSTNAITVSSVAGTRTVYQVTANTAMPPPQGTVQVVYKFVTGGHTYFIHYDRYPGDPDQTAEFDRMVTETLAFHS